MPPTGEGRVSLVWKSIAGVLWGGIAYLLRVLLVLFIEPQVNPLKHFPVVTISHKLLLPMIPTLTAALLRTTSLSAWTASLIATIIIGKIPGLFSLHLLQIAQTIREHVLRRRKAGGF